VNKELGRHWKEDTRVVDEIKRDLKLTRKVVDTSTKVKGTSKRYSLLNKVVTTKGKSKNEDTNRMEEIIVWLTNCLDKIVAFYKLYVV